MLLGRTGSPTSLKVDHMRLVGSTLSLVLCTGPIAAQGSSPLRDFKVLSTPRQGIPIGAIWQNFGPDGDGLPESQLRVKNSLSAFTSDRSIQAQANLGIINWLGLSASVAGRTQITYDSVEVVTVADLLRAGLQPGNKVLYEGIRVRSFQVANDLAGAGGLRAAAAKALGDDGSARVSSDGSVRLAGTDL